MAGEDAPAEDDFTQNRQQQTQSKQIQTLRRQTRSHSTIDVRLKHSNVSKRNWLLALTSAFCPYSPQISFAAENLPAVTPSEQM
jgi:hypothetical protein